MYTQHLLCSAVLFQRAFFRLVLKCMRSILPFDTINRAIRVSLSLCHSILFLLSSHPLSPWFRSIAHGRFWYPRGVPSFCSVLLRLVAGPVTNHDSSARERRGHTTLGSGSGACCHPLRRPPLRSASRRPPGRYPLTLLLLLLLLRALPRNYCASQQRTSRTVSKGGQVAPAAALSSRHDPSFGSPRFASSFILLFVSDVLKRVCL